MKYKSIFFSAPPPPPPGCPADWIDSEEGCFYFANEVGNEGMTWYDAVEYCKDIKDGYLAEVLNAETQALLVEEASALPPTNWWLGASDEETVSTFKYIENLKVGVFEIKSYVLKFPFAK